MVDPKQPTGEGEAMDMDDIRLERIDRNGRLLNVDLSNLRRTISAPSVNGSDMDDQTSVFRRNNGSKSTENSSNNISPEQRPRQRSRTRTYSAGSQLTQMVLNVDVSSTSPPVRLFTYI